MKNQKFDDSDFNVSSGTNRHGAQTCVEVAVRKDVIGVRNSNDSQKITVIFTPEEWKAFVFGVKNGEFDV